MAGLAVAAAVAQDPRTYGGSPIQRLRADERPRAFEVMQSICANVKVSLSSNPPSRRALLHTTQGIKTLKVQSLLTAILGGIRGVQGTTFSRDIIWWARSKDEPSVRTGCFEVGREVYSLQAT